jgi:hypothetical protein
MDYIEKPEARCKYCCVQGELTNPLSVFREVSRNLVKRDVYACSFCAQDRLNMPGVYGLRKFTPNQEDMARYVAELPESRES